LYEDSFDYERLLVELLRPLGESDSRLYRTEIYDRRTDLLVDSEQMEASADAILLFDGVFLLRPSWSTRGISASSSPSPPKRSSAARASATPRCTDHLMMLSGGSAPGTCRPSGTTAARFGRPSSPTLCSRTTTRPSRAYSCGAESGRGERRLGQCSGISPERFR
jgi:hypothetical protein